MRRPHPLGAVRWQTIVGLLLLFLAAASVNARVCFSSGFQYGLWTDECPDGEPRQVVLVEADGLTRGASSRVHVRADAHFAVRGEQTRSLPVDDLQATVALVSAGRTTELTPKGPWAKEGRGLQAEVELPHVNDGEYTLRTTVTSRLGTTALDLPLPLYAPAAVHLLTDRPLYEPGNTVQFRALVLRASGLAPLEERPGVWRVVDPGGEVLLEEKAPTGAWGVVAGSFPLDRSAASGEWTVSWSSGDASGSRRFTVKPFTLPRFRVEASPGKPFYRRGERPTLKGVVRYGSGAPVRAATVALRWSFAGAWPPPTAWTDGPALPTSVVTDPAGSFTVELPAVPPDLQGQVSVAADLSAVDASGDRVEGRASLLLSEDAIAVSAVTELAGGLVEGFNNRLYLRATTADGRGLTAVTLDVKRLWEPTDRGTTAEADEDGVAQLQVDPGPAVNIVIPALPFRPPARTPAVQLERLTNRLAGPDRDEDATLADRMRLDGLLARLSPCARFSRGGEALQVGVLVGPSGAAGPLAAPSSPLGRCVARVLEPVRFEAGPQRFYDATWRFDDSALPRFSVEVNGLPRPPVWLERALGDALLDARECLPATVRSGRLPRLLTWHRAAGSGPLVARWVPAKGDPFPEAAVACVTSRVSQLGPPPAGEVGPAAVGVARVSVSAPAKYEDVRPQDTVMVGYEFLVTARQGREVVGSTRLRVAPGTVPPLRLRADRQVVEPGSTVTVELVRGPDFQGELPKTVVLTQAYRSVEAKVDPETRKAALAVPADWEGWAAVEWSLGKVFFFVRPRSTLQVGLAAEQPRYAPGQTARLLIDTRVAGAPGPAAVGLFGVDESLQQLAPLPGPDELSALRPQPASGGPALGGLDAQALALGRVRGANAAAATLLRVTALPAPPSLEAAVRVAGRTPLDANGTLVDRFYGVLAELATQVREWEVSAPAKEKLLPATMAGLWSRALIAADRRHEPTRDLWGRPLRLHRLPPDLLALTEPRALVVDGTRLPEDTQNWAQWVAKEKP